MGYAAEEIKKVSPEEYLELERSAEYKSELINGEIYAMSGTTRKHNKIAGNIFAQLHIFLRNKPCSVYFADLKVKVEKTNMFTYPDIAITCGKESLADKYKDTLLNPKCIIEVLSESTEKYDRGDKFAHYQKIESLEEYILVSQNQNKIETFLRQPNGKWLYELTEDLENELYIHTVEAKIPLKDIYFNTDSEIE